MGLMGLGWKYLKSRLKPPVVIFVCNSIHKSSCQSVSDWPIVDQDLGNHLAGEHLAEQPSRQSSEVAAALPCNQLLQIIIPLSITIANHRQNRFVHKKQKCDATVVLLRFIIKENSDQNVLYFLSVSECPKIKSALNPVIC